MEPAYGGDVASRGADGQVLVTTGPGLLDNPADEDAANTLIPSCLSDDDRLDFGTRHVAANDGEWGGWGSNLRPTDYESSPPAALAMLAELGRHGSARSWLPRFGHVFGMIKLDTARYL